MTYFYGQIGYVNALLAEQLTADLAFCFYDLDELINH